MAGCVYITTSQVTNDYTTYVHGEAYQGPSKTGHPYKQQYEKWLASKAAYYRSQGIYTELEEQTTFVPTRANIMVELAPAYTPKKVREKFDVEAFRNGSLYRDGFI